MTDSVLDRRNGNELKTGLLKAGPEFDAFCTLATDKFTGVIAEEEIREQIERYERMFEMSSEEFLYRVREGTAPDGFEAMDWKILLRYG